MSIFQLNCPLNPLKCPSPFQNTTALVKAESLEFLGCESVNYLQENKPIVLEQLNKRS